MASTAASGTVWVVASARISRSSLRMTPSYPSSSLSSPCTMVRDSVAGCSSSNDGTSTCAVMMKATFALMASRNGITFDPADPIRRMLDDRQVEM